VIPDERLAGPPSRVGEKREGEGCQRQRSYFGAIRNKIFAQDGPRTGDEVGDDGGKGRDPFRNPFLTKQDFRKLALSGHPGNTSLFRRLTLV
jgi:hypothetical protein